MASTLRAFSFADLAPANARKEGTGRWGRVVLLTLLVPIGVAFGTPVLAFALLAAVLAAPLGVATFAVLAAQHDRRA